MCMDMAEGIFQRGNLGKNLRIVMPSQRGYNRYVHRTSFVVPSQRGYIRYVHRTSIVVPSQRGHNRYVHKTSFSF